MKTIAYIDGYNLYYGILRSNGFKWIDIYSLLEIICKIQNPKSELLKVKYFTAPVKSNFATHGNDSNKSQQTYHNALKEIHGDNIEIIKGYHTIDRATPPLYKNPIDLNDRTEVWKFEEKQTDVNIAMNMYRDAIREEYGQQVLVSSDSDLEAALKFIKEDKPEITIGLVMPKPKLTDDRKARPITAYLDNHSHWTRDHILDEECLKSLLPDKIPTKKKPIVKPHYW
ncbi:MAG: NYN domain-containing protein [Proteobacteria bacterium]|nr:NYN domain-containing protein [Pseudomonadota bacterium]NOG60657.1 NYN domain-containing protein [Pseudomonadota bacterium]